MKTTRSSDGMVGSGRDESRCKMLSSHGVAFKWARSAMSYCGIWQVQARYRQVDCAPGASYTSTLSATFHFPRLPCHPHLFESTPTFAETIDALECCTMEPDAPKAAELQKLAYETLSKYFLEHEDEVITIEILPPAIQPPDGILMQEGLCLGVAKKALALAYVEARQRFFANRQGRAQSTMTQTMQATKVMLLFDPEHLTAANYRKRVLHLLESEHGLNTGNPCHKALRRELCFLDSILTSPLHRQSKSPTLWYHRSRILDSLSFIELAEALEDKRALLWRSELDAVCKSGERHPKNYHAWQYARRFVRKADGLNIDETFGRHVKDWCCRHPADISGWSFLLYLMPRLARLLEQELVREVLKYAIGLNLTQESLWVFMRTALAQNVSNADHSATYQLLQAHVKDLGNDQRGKAPYEVVFNCLKWVDAHRDFAE